MVVQPVLALGLSERELELIEKAHLQNEKQFYLRKEARKAEELEILGNVEECYGCGVEIEDDYNKKVGLDDEIYCEDCFYEKYEICAYCWDTIDRDDARWSEVKEELYCPDCYSQNVTICYACHDEVNPNYSFYSERDGETYCESCFSEIFTYCEGCNEIIYRDDAFYNEGEDYCEECYDEHRNIKRYEYKPSPEFKTGRNEKKKRNTLFFGLELEVENEERKTSNSDMAETVQGILDDCYCKEDASLRTGFEIVTHPFTWAWYRKNRKQFDDTLAKLKENDFKSYDPGTCGIHIHISKAAFTTLHLFKFLKFYYEGENFKGIYGVSQRTESSSRDSSQWGYYRENKTQKTQLKEAKDKQTDDRYTAINLTKDTAEIRIFRGTLNEKSFHKNFEFVKASFEFTLETGVKEINWLSFVNYVKENRKIYSNLYEFLKKKCFFMS